MNVSDITRWSPLSKLTNLPQAVASALQRSLSASTVANSFGKEGLRKVKHLAPNIGGAKNHGFIGPAQGPPQYLSLRGGRPQAGDFLITAWRREHQECRHLAGVLYLLHAPGHETDGKRNQKVVSQFPFRLVMSIWDVCGLASLVFWFAGVAVGK